MKLKAYFRVLEGGMPAYHRVRSTEVDETVLADLRSAIGKEGPVIEDLINRAWEEHGRAVARSREVTEARQVECSLLDLKLALAADLMRSCGLCERGCLVDRTEGERGACGVAIAMEDGRWARGTMSSEFLHMGEEGELVPSHTIFMSGCNLDCVFCQNWSISQDPDEGRTVDIGTMVKIIEWGGGRNVNWVGGDPIPHLPFILEVLRDVEVRIPMVWNSNMFLTERSMALLSGTIDLYLTDMKYGNDDCGKALSGVDRYWSTIRRNHILAGEDADLLIRHLVLPGHVDCCTGPIVEWIGENVPEARLNLMDQYRPEHRAAMYPHLDRRLTDEEWKRAVRLAEDRGLI